MFSLFMKSIKNHWYLFFIVIVAILLRFFQLSSNPPSLTWDEAAWGYNAYSLGIDGRDEFGRFLPHDYLESFGDFKPPVYAYLDILPVKLFGLTEFATRFPSAFFGVLTVAVTYFLTRRIFYNSQRRNLIALLGAAILAISPWHVLLSRAAFEANVATFFIVSAVWLFLESMQGKRWYLLLSAVCFVLSMYTFNTARIVSPFLVVLLGVGFRKILFKHLKTTIWAGIVGLLLLFPTLGFLLSPQASLRFKEVNIFSDHTVVERANQYIENDRNVWWSNIIHNRRVLFGIEFLRHYFDNLNPDFLFIKGDGNPKFSTQGTGQLYLWEPPFLIIGLIALFRKKEGYWWVIPVWLFVGILPAATARETPHALRIETVVPTLQILVAYGAVTFLYSLKSSIRTWFYAVLSLVVLLNFIYFLHIYFVHYRYDFSGEWQYGYKEAIAYANSVKEDYDAVSMTTALGRPYIYTLFHSKIDPLEFRKSMKVNRDPFGFVTVKGFNTFHFISDPDLHGIVGRVLVINAENQQPANAKILKTFYLLNGKTALIAYIVQ